MNQFWPNTRWGWETYVCVVYQDHQDRRVGNDLVNNFYNQMVAGGCVCGSMQFARACQLNTHLLC